MKGRKSRILIFDAYGTIINTKNGSVEATAKILNKNNSKEDPVLFYKCWKKTHKEIISQQEDFILESEVFRIGLNKLYHQFQIPGNADEDVSIILETLGIRDAFPEVNYVFQKLKKSFYIIIGSNSDSDTLFQDIERNGIFADEVFTSESLEVYKPDKKFYRKIMDHFPDYAENDFTFIGDSEIEDILIPQEMGMNTIWINRKNKELHKDIKPGRVISSLEELLTL